MSYRKHSVFALLAASLVTACGGETNQTTGAGGAGGAGGSGGGSGGSGGVTQPDPDGPKDPDVALRAAVILGSCLPDDGVNRILQRIYSRRGDLAGFLPSDYTECISSHANGCAALEACFGITVKRATAPCDATCNGAVLHACGDGLEYEANCSKIGLACSAEERTCVPATGPGPGPACDFSTFTPSCQDGAPLFCNDYETRGPVCADYGLVCGTPPFGDVACLGTGPSCTPGVVSVQEIHYDEGIACNAEKLRACINGGEQEVDCATLVKGFTCQTSGTASFCGLAGACDPTAGADATCEGDSVVVCNAGRIDKVDCKSVGFTGCNATWGTCSPSIYDDFVP
jgi:hypothetical protein